MKKTYITPASEPMALNAEGPILDGSLNINNGYATQWTRKERHGWNCDDWSGTDIHDDEY